MRLGGGVKPVERFRGDHQGSIETEGNFRTAQVVVNRLGHANHRDTFIEQFHCDAQCAIPPDDDDRVQMHGGNGLDNFI